MSPGDQPQSPSTTAQLAGKVLHLLEDELIRLGFELLDVRIFQGGGRFQVRIYVDLPGGGITLDRCTQAARSASMLLEEADLFPGQYVIEVSSPGIRRPLRKREHFEAAVGEKVDLKFKPGGERSRLRGTLVEVKEETLIVAPVAAAEAEDKPAPVDVALESLAEANLDPEFDAQALINADRRKRKEDRREIRRAKAGKKRKGRPKAGKNTPSDTDGNDSSD